MTTITQLRLVAVGHIDTQNPLNDSLVCDPTFESTWETGIVDAIDAAPPDYPHWLTDLEIEEMAAEADDYEWDMYDRERHARGQW